MERSSLGHLQGLVDDSRKNDVSYSVQPKLHNLDDLNQHQSDDKGNEQTTEVETKKGTNVREQVVTDVPGDINMEASISPDDVIRGGGFGARDDMNSFLPAASDFTDFEASLLDAREYEEPQEEVRRPGLGWTGAEK